MTHWKALLSTPRTQFLNGRARHLGVFVAMLSLLTLLWGGVFTDVWSKTPVAKPKLDPLPSATTQNKTATPSASGQTVQTIPSDVRVQQQLDALEMILLGITQPDKPIPTRLDQLETLVFGQPSLVPASVTAKLSPSLKQEKATAYRLDRIQKQVDRFQPQTAAAPNQSASPTAMPSSTNSPPTIPGSHPPGMNPAESDYPTVTQIEQQLFGQTYVKEDVTVRLNRIETKIYGKPMPGVLADRVDRLRPLFEANAPAAYSPPGYSPPPAPQGYPPGTPPPTNMYGYQGNTASTPAPSNPYVNSMPPIQGDPQILYSLDSLEQRIFKYTYPMDTVQNRLDRLESAVFQTKAPPGVSEQERIDRLQAVNAVAEDQRSSGGRAFGRRSTIQTLLPFLIMSLLIAL